MKTPRGLTAMKTQRGFTAMKTQRGFTLIEILIVIAILGSVMALAAGAAPRRGGGLDLTAAAQGVARSLRQARAQAIALDRPVLFAPVAGGRGYIVDGVARSLPPNTTLAMSGPAAIRFDPSGGANGGDILVAGTAHALIVRTEWVTGRVIILEGR
jgi:prepilin-type N-terminal cleavage/methylation domain-containing protein